MIPVTVDPLGATSVAPSVAPLGRLWRLWRFR